MTQLLELLTLQDLLELRQCSKIHKAKIDICMEPLCRATEMKLSELGTEETVQISKNMLSDLEESCRPVIGMNSRSINYVFHSGAHLPSIHLQNIEAPSVKNLVCLIVTLASSSSDKICSWQDSREAFREGLVFKQLQGLKDSNFCKLNFIRLAVCVNKECYKNSSISQALEWKSLFDKLLGILRSYIKVCQIVQNKILDYHNFTKRQALLMKLFVCQGIMERVQEEEFNSIRH